MWKWLIGIVVVLLVLVGGSVGAVMALGGPEEIMGKFKPEPQITKVKIEPVIVGNLVRTVNAPGTVLPRTEVQIGAQVSAKITALPFEVGDYVEEGEVVCRLDADDVEASLRSAEASLKSEQARLEGAQADLIDATLNRDRYAQLFETRDVSEAQRDEAQARFLRAKSSLKMVEHSIEIAQANIERARKNLDYTVIKAPLSGFITMRNVDIGEQVLGTFNNAGTTIMEIADMSEMIMHARVDESNVAPVKSGQTAEVFINAYGQERAYPGIVERVKLKKQIDRDGTHYFETDILLELSEGDEIIKTGLTANADIQVETLYDIVKVPSQSVLDKRVEELPSEVLESNEQINRDKTFARVVFVFEDGKALMKPVTIGPSDLTHTVIMTGLSPDDMVITGPYKTLGTLSHEMDVRDRDAEPEPDPAEAEGAADDEAGDDAAPESTDDTSNESGGDQAADTASDTTEPATDAG